MTAADGAAGIEAAARERPDLILMDLSLPGVDGWEATRRLKARARDRGDSGDRADRACHAGRRGAGPRLRLRRLSDQADRRGRSCSPSWRACSARARHEAHDRGRWQVVAARPRARPEPAVRRRTSGGRRIAARHACPAQARRPSRLTLGQSSTFSLSLLPWSMRPWQSARARCLWADGLPGSHGPSEERVDEQDVDGLVNVSPPGSPSKPARARPLCQATPTLGGTAVPRSGAGRQSGPRSGAGRQPGP